MLKLWLNPPPKKKTSIEEIFGISKILETMYLEFST